MAKLPTNIFRRKGKAKYYGSFKDGCGKWRQRALSRDLATSKTLLRDLENKAELARAGIVSSDSDGRLSDAVECYLDDLRARVTEAHFGNTRARLYYMQDQLIAMQPLRRGKSLADAFRVVDVRLDDVLKIRAGLLSREVRPVSNRTANLYTDAIATCLGWARKTRRAPTNPLEDLERLPEGGEHAKRKRYRLTVAEMSAVKRAAIELDTERPASEFAQAIMIEILLGTGFRYGEMGRLQWRDIVEERESKYLICRRGKARRGRGGKPRIAPISDELFHSLERHRKRQAVQMGRPVGLDDFIVLTISGKQYTRNRNAYAGRVLRAVLDHAGIERDQGSAGTVDVHGLRGSFCTALMQAGVDLLVAKKLMGHSSTKVTLQHYTDEERIPTRDSIAKLERLFASEEKRRKDPEGSAAGAAEAAE